MPILSGSASITRFNVTVPAEGPEFQEHTFTTIEPGSEVRESIGFIPFEPGAEYQIGHSRYAFRVRIDRLTPDPTAVRERFRDLVRAELEETDSTFVNARRRKQLRNLAQEELLLDARPSSRIVEGVIEDRLLYVGTSANNVIGKIIRLLSKAGVVAEFRTPWLERGDADIESELMEVYDPGQSIAGSRFVQGVLGDQEVMVDPSSGHVKLQTRDARITVTGGVLPELHRHIDEGCEVMAAKLLTATTSFRLDALSFRLSGLKLERSALEHWTERLDERLEQIVEVFELLDRKYDEWRVGSRGRAADRRARRAPVAARDSTEAEERKPETPDNVVAFDSAN